MIRINQKMRTLELSINKINEINILNLFSSDTSLLLKNEQILIKGK